jgi:uncharacterized membrane protein YhaH (DUF805 family)/uncharacterized Zn-finger protein
MKWYFKALTNFRFKGRACRKEYWLFCLFNIVIILLLDFVIPSILFPSLESSLLFGANLILWIVSLLYFLWVFIPGITVVVRRLHDTGRSGWWYWIVLIPIIGVIILLIFMLLPSSEGLNKYGNPYGENDSGFIPPVINHDINSEIAKSVSGLPETEFHKKKLSLNKPVLKQNSKIEIFCPRCNTKYKVDSSLMGAESECKACECKFIINSNLIYNNDSSKFSIKCPMCEHKYELDSNLKGRKVSCANCDTLFIA